MSGYDYMVQADYDRLMAELEELKTKGRKKAAEAIAEAREKGDLSENAEYDAAKEAQGLLELRINELEKKMAMARVLDETKVDTSKVTVLTRVTIKNKATNKKMTYQLVSESVADLKAKKLSVSSPMGEGLLGKKIGEVAIIDTPRGQMEFEVVDISA